MIITIDLSFFHCVNFLHSDSVPPQRLPNDRTTHYHFLFCSLLIKLVDFFIKSEYSFLSIVV